MRIIAARKRHVDTAAHILAEAYYDSFKEAKRRVIQKMKTKEIFVAIENGSVIGVMIYSRDYSHYANFIEDISVSIGHRRRGAALGLIRKFVEISRKETPKKQKYALSSTDARNKASISLHKKAGFMQIGRLRGLHYGKDEIFFAYELR